MGIGRVIALPKKPTKVQRDRYWVEVNGSPVNEVPLKKSREVKLEYKSRRGFRSTDSHKKYSARYNPKTDGLLHDKGIQIHRLWFQYLKLALELEELGATTLVTKQGKDVKQYEINKVANLPATRVDGFKLKDTVPIKVKRNKYEGWDLKQVLNDSFDKWWKTHSYLFEGHLTTFTKPNDNQNPDDFFYVRIDKKANIQDVSEFINVEVRKQLKGAEPRFKIGGYPNPKVMQNGYNAIVLTLKGWGRIPEKQLHTIWEGKDIYFRATDDIRSGGNKLVVAEHKGKKQFSNAMSKQRNVGIHHLVNVMNGKFGDLPSRGIDYT